MTLSSNFPIAPELVSPELAALLNRSSPEIWAVLVDLDERERKAPPQMDGGQVQRESGWSPSTIRNKRIAGKLKSFRDGKKRLYVTSFVFAEMKERLVAAFPADGSKQPPWHPRGWKQPQPKREEIPAE
jgi:hypothetical protein